VLSVNGFDIDGVIHQGVFGAGIRPGLNDIIITGRSLEESKETLFFLRKNGINNIVFFNPVSFNEKTRKSSGTHKAKTINKLLEMGIKINLFFEDDEVQAAEIQKATSVTVVRVISNHVEKENVRHLEDLDD
jgi:hypothetical protein